MNQFSGAGVAIITPFKEDKSIDFESLEKLVNHLIDEHINYLVVLGTTGESVTLTRDERIEIIEFVVQVNGGRIPIVMGMGGNNTREVVYEIEKFNFSGIDALLSVAPIITNPANRDFMNIIMLWPKQVPYP